MSQWLKIRNQQDFDRALAEIYDPRSARYHQWMTEEQLAKFKPTHSQLATVSRELESNGLKVTVDPNGLYVRAQGTVASLQSAFHTPINLFEKSGATFRANTTVPTLGAAVDDLLLTVAGLDEEAVARPFIHRQAELLNGLPELNVQQADSLPPLSSIFTNQCFQPPATVTIGGPADVPRATYSGNVYDPKPLICGPGPTRTARRTRCPALSNQY
jgi:subtilase family serine protease